MEIQCWKLGPGARHCDGLSLDCCAFEMVDGGFPLRERVTADWVGPTGVNIYGLDHGALASAVPAGGPGHAAKDSNCVVQPKKERKEKKEKRKRMCGERYQRQNYGDTPRQPKEQGSFSDIKHAWGKMYKEEGWDKFATFDKKGGVNTPYALLIRQII